LLGDCHLLAPLAAMVSTTGGRAAIRDAISERKNEKNEVVAYSVRLYDRPWLRPYTLEETLIEVPAHTPYVVGHAKAMSDGQRYEVWPLLVEKAYAQLRGGYNIIGRNAPVLGAMEALTGREVAHLDASQVPEAVFADRDKVVVLSSRHGIEPNAYKLKDDHAYALVKRVGGGERVLELYNPWGTEEPTRVPISEVAKWFSSVDIGSLRGTP
jgi:hypothetical protein